MTILFDPSKNVNPTSPESFGQGIAPDRRERRKPYTSADLAWAAAELNKGATDYDVIVPAPRPISGGAPCEVWERLAAEVEDSAMWDHHAAESLAIDSLSRGLIPADLADYISRTTLVGHPA